jgi:hypothetical protein
LKTVSISAALKYPKLTLLMLMLGQLASPAIALESPGIPAANTSVSAATKAQAVSEGLEFEEPDEPGIWTSFNGYLSKNGLQGKSNNLNTMRLEPSSRNLLVGTVDASDGDPIINSQLSMLNKEALGRSSRMKDARDAYNHYNTVKSKAITKSKDALNILITYRGFCSSKEASDILLDEKLRLNGLPASELMLQKEIDSVDSTVVQSLFQIAMGLGLSDPERQLDVVSKSFKDLSVIVGDEAAQNAVSSLAGWKKRLRAPEEIYSSQIWSPAELKEKTALILDSAKKKDPFIAKTTKQLHRYNNKSKLVMASSSVIEGALGIACLTPTCVGTGAQIVLTGYEMANGGSEENKLVKQIYLSKRLDSRNTLLKSKAELALQHYQLGVLTRNLPLIALSESMISQMSNEEVAKKVLGKTLAEANEPAQNKKTTTTATDGVR